MHQHISTVTASTAFERRPAIPARDPECLHLACTPQAASLGPSVGTQRRVRAALTTRRPTSAPVFGGEASLSQPYPAPDTLGVHPTVHCTAPRPCAPEPHHPSAPQGHPQQLSHCITPAWPALQVRPLLTFPPL